MAWEMNIAPRNMSHIIKQDFWLSKDKSGQHLTIALKENRKNQYACCHCMVKGITKNLL
jgi:hypothetical protein